jgi:AAA domain-containing protein
MRSLSERVLVDLFEVVPYTMSLTQAEDGGLRDAFLALASPPPEPKVDAPGLRRLIESALEQRTGAVASSLPVTLQTARLALANYASTHSNLALRLSPDGMTLAWGRGKLVDCFRRMRWSFDGPTAIQSFIELLGGSANSDETESTGLASRLATLSDDPIFTLPFVVAARSGGADVAVLREVARHALQTSPESRAAVLLISEPLAASMLAELRDVQSFLPVTIIVVDIDTCVAMSQSREPARERLRHLMLEQTDLTKLSPFVVRGVTPSRVFFGREEEEAALLSTLPTNSVALLGARRIGKTSLMRHSFGRLQAADLRPFFGDCQVVRTWVDFGGMASRNWDVNLPTDFKPQHLFELVDQLSDSSGRSTVILLDEIDQLLDWDKAHTEDEVPEAFFRACRSISQQGIAQFVFSGERTIANRIWDATSPHWNFCRPLMLQQLTRAAASSLIAEPLEALGVRIEDRDAFLSVCWDSTDGHPELLQLLGDRIVSHVNQRDRKDVSTSPADVLQITGQFDFAEQYLETYWGQANPLERIVSILLIDGPKTIEQLMSGLESITPARGGEDLRSALHMLELYGIADQSEAGYQLRALWFTAALPFYGGPEMAIKRYAGMLKT